MDIKRKVQVWIFHRDIEGHLWTLLLKTLPSRGSFGQPVTGGVEEGETLEQAALREAQEETSFSFSDSVRSSGKSFRYSKNGIQFEEQGFALFVDQKLDPRLDSHEHQAFQWLKLEDAFPALKFSLNAEMLKFWVHLFNSAG